MAIRFVERRPERPEPERGPAAAGLPPAGAQRPGSPPGIAFEDDGQENAEAPPTVRADVDGASIEEAAAGGDLLPGIEPPRRPPRRRRNRMMGFG